MMELFIKTLIIIRLQLLSLLLVFVVRLPETDVPQVAHAGVTVGDVPCSGG